MSINGYAVEYDYTDYYSILNFLNVQYDKQDLDRLVYHSGARRGDISILLKSPHRTNSLLLPYRRRDFINSEGFDSWPLMSVLHWGEDPRGLWSISISYRSTTGYATVNNVTVSLYGSATVPEAVSRIPAECDPACKGRCTAPGPRFCDSCRVLRNATTLECVASCPDEFRVHSGYCLDPSINYTYTPDWAGPAEELTPSSPSAASEQSSFQVSPSTTLSLNAHDSTSSSHSDSIISTVSRSAQYQSRSRSISGTTHSQQQQTAAVSASPTPPEIPTLVVPSKDPVSSGSSLHLHHAWCTCILYIMFLLVLFFVL